MDNEPSPQSTQNPAVQGNEDWYTANSGTTLRQGWSDSGNQPWNSRRHNRLLEDLAGSDLASMGRLSGRHNVCLFSLARHLEHG